MRLYTNGQKLAAWTFIIVAAASSVYLVAAARDSVLLYDSLSQLGFTLTSMRLDGNVTGMAIIIARLQADNPVDFGALTVTQVSLTTFFSSDSSTEFQESPLSYGWLVSRSLSAHGSTSWDFTMQLSSENSTSLYSFYQTHNRNITANTSIQVYVTTKFLSALTGATIFRNQQNLTLT